MEKPFTDELREAVRTCGLTRYAISKRTGIDQAVLCRFVAGGGMSLKSVDRLMDVLGLKITIGRKRKES
jgi:hypothetical protein